MQLTLSQLTQLIAHAHADAPNETCGIIAGSNDRALKIFPLPNNAPNPRVEYNAEPHALLEAFREIDAHGWEHLAIYHSHPATPAYPSPTDLARAFYLDVIYVVISLMNPDQAMVRGFRLGAQVKEVTLEIEDDESQRENPRRTARRANRSRPGRAVATLSRRRSKTGNPVRKRR